MAIVTPLTMSAALCDRATKLATSRGFAGVHLHAVGRVTTLSCSERYGEVVHCGGQQLLFTRRNLAAQPWFDTLVRTRPSSDANFSEPSSAFDSSQLILLSYNAAFMCLADGVTVVAYGGQGTARPLGIRLASADASKLPLRWSAPARVISSNASATGCIEARDPVLFLLPKVDGGICDYDGKLSVVGFAGRVFMYARFNLAPQGGARHVGVTSSPDGQRWERFQTVKIHGYNSGPASNNIYYFAVQHARDMNLLVAFYPAAIEGRGGVFRSTSSDGVRWTAPECLLPSTIHAGYRTRDHPLDALLLAARVRVASSLGSYRVLIEHNVDIRTHGNQDSDCKRAAPIVCEYAMRRAPDINQNRLHKPI